MEGLGEDRLSKSNRAFLCAFIAVVFSCSPGFAQNFSNQTASLAAGMGDGNVSWGDYNNDGYVDLVTGGTLWRNKGDGTGFVSMGGGGTALHSVWADYNNDGLLDMYKFSREELWRNNGNWSFTQVPIPVLPGSNSLGAAWADHNNDGYVDLYAADFGTDSILRNVGGTSFTKTWQQSPSQFGRGVTSADFDRDGDQDVYVSNYWLQPNLLWQNDGNGNFTNVAPSLGVAGYTGGTYPNGHTIGSAWGDFDNDGNFDLFVGNFRHNWGDGSQDYATFFRNLGGSSGFVEMARLDGADWLESYGSPALADYDNDGDLDLFFTTVYSGDAPRLYRNDGNWNFTNVTSAEGLAGLGTTYHAAWGDYDDDGDLELVTDGKIFVNNENQTGTNHWLKVKLTGDGISVNSAAIGSEVRINLGGGQILTRQVEGGTGQGSQNELTLHFGLGSHAGLVDLEISVQGMSWTIAGVAVDQTVACTVPAPWSAGDVNGDGFVGGADISRVIQNWGMASPTRSDGDVAGPGGTGPDGVIGIDDYNAIRDAWGLGTPPEPGEPDHVPEPATTLSLLLGGLVLFRRRME